jgi:hypothetical protein
MLRSAPGRRQQEDAMSRAFVSEGNSVPQVFASAESAESAANLQRAMDGRDYDYEVRPRERGGYMVARLRKDGTFDSWVEE